MPQQFNMPQVVGFFLPTRWLPGQDTITDAVLEDPYSEDDRLQR